MLTRLGPVASGGRLDTCSVRLQNRKVVVSETCHCDIHEWEELKQENTCLKQSLREFELQYKVAQPSEIDELASSLVEAYIKVVNNRCEIIVPLRQVIDTSSSLYALKKRFAY